MDVALWIRLHFVGLRGHDHLSVDRGAIPKI